MLPFTEERFFDLFAEYYAALGSTSVAALWALAACAVASVALRARHGTRIALAILAVLWLVNGAGFHMMFFSRLTPLGYVFGVLFAIEALLLGVAATRDDIELSLADNPWGDVASLFAAIALAGYTILGYAAGHVPPRAPIPGSAPCPTVILTGALLLASVRRIPWWLVPIPLAWGAFGTTAAFLLGVGEDLLLGLATIALLYRFVRERAGVTGGVARRTSGSPRPTAPYFRRRLSGTRR
jgi:hypothetical protein